MAFFKPPIPSVGLALGGGGARGLAHLGVLRVLEGEKIPIRCIAGTSAGAIIGAMIAQLGSSAEVEERVRNYFSSDRYRSMSRRLTATKQKDARTKNGLIDRMFTFVKQQYVVNKAFQDLGLLDRGIVESALRALIDEEDIRDTRIPFAAVATDLWKGEDVVLRRGSIRRAVLASASIPGIFPPVEWDGRSLVDGCVINMVPVHEARDLGADRVMAVDVTRELVRPRAFKNGLEIMFRSDEITNYRLNEVHLGTADVVVRPRMGDAHWADFDRLDEFIGLGEAAAEERLPEIRALVRPARRRWFGSLFGLGPKTKRGAPAPASR